MIAHSAIVQLDELSLAGAIAVGGVARHVCTRSVSGPFGINDRTGFPTNATAAIGSCWCVDVVSHRSVCISRCCGCSGCRSASSPVPSASYLASNERIESGERGLAPALLLLLRPCKHGPEALALVQDLSLFGWEGSRFTQLLNHPPDVVRDRVGQRKR